MYILSDGSANTGPGNDRGLREGTVEQNVRGERQVRFEDDRPDCREQGKREKYLGSHKSLSHREDACADTRCTQERFVQVFKFKFYFG